ncbi:uncharacterized protein [Hyperolius riggenbachi]|uniref:uncharacterized protein n=1 Tax=Hyperolius riggenbachi TaxID=752182 RepID=UPI0035A36568
MSESQTSSYKTRSKVSRSTRSSSVSNAAAIARAEAEAAKARAAFAEQEMQLKLQQATLETERAKQQAALEKLSAQREAAAAIAKAEALEALIHPDDERHSRPASLDLAHQDPLQRTSDYVHRHSRMIDSFLSMEDAQRDLIDRSHQTQFTAQTENQNKPPASKPEVNIENELISEHLPPCPELQPAHNVPGTSPYTPNRYETFRPKRETTDRYDYTPLSHYGNTPPSFPAPAQTSMDIVKFLTRRELVAKGLVKFDDHPESYRAWRSSFKNTIKDVELSPSEEMDLLAKWLGTASAEHVKRIRSINIRNPAAGLKMVWDRLDECYGSVEAIENSLFKRIEDFPKIASKGLQKLRELSDLLMELQVAKSEGDLSGLAYFDTARGVNLIVQKLTPGLQNEWVKCGSNYKKKYHVSFPPFSVFVDFIHDQAKIRNDPSFDFALTCTSVPGLPSHKASVAVHKTELSSPDSPHRFAGSSQAANKVRDPGKQCPIHRRPHSLLKCRGFREKPIEERKAFLRENSICYKCCSSTTHFAKNCKFSENCKECDSTDHNTALHPGPAPWTLQHTYSTTEHGGEEGDTPTVTLEVTPQCTEVCKGATGGRSCSKMCLVRVYPAEQREKAVKMYAILDDQSNGSLAHPTFFDMFNVKGPSSPYSLRTCAGIVETAGRRASGFQIEAIDGSICLPLPTLIECNQIPDHRSEIPTPDVALHHAHLKRIAHLIPELDPQAKIILLLGRDILRIHKVRKQIDGSHDAPYAQKLDLGWVIIGEVCLGRVHKPDTVHSMFTSTLASGRPSLFQPCVNNFLIKELPCASHLPCPFTDVSSDNDACDSDQDHLGCRVFQRSKDDNRVALSIEDKQFLEIMERDFVKDSTNSWVAPLPFRTQRRRLPNNKVQVLKRFSSLRRNFQRKPEMREHFFSFMQKIFENNHAEIDPPLKGPEECWYLPIFGVYHPKKPGQIRVVFDSSAKFEGISLNDVLLTGPDLNNKLLGVLLRFRKDTVALIADIQQMFHCFLVKEKDRNFLRFLWFKDNDPSKDIIEYRMRVHIFGNSPSPAVAIYGLRRSAQEGEREYGLDTRQFVERDFYVDDCLKSLPSNDSAISLLKRAQDMLACSNLRLHKIASNSKEVMEAFPSEDHSNDLRDLDLGSETLPVQRSLGLLWDLKSDTFTFQVSKEEKPFTRRGVLSAINSLYDPLGFAAPVTIQGKALLRDLTRETTDWDVPLPPDKKNLWVEWRNSLAALSSLKVARTYAPVPSTDVQDHTLCVFSDASVKAISAVAYLRTIDIKGQCHIGFVMGKAKLAPQPEHTIPRLELCAAVLAVEMAELITSEIDIDLKKAEFYTDSKVVLGYINNESRRFYVYVNNRVLRIRKSTSPEQWHYVSTDNNPADHATRAVAASHLKNTTWFTGPAFLCNSTPAVHQNNMFELVDEDSDTEIRPQVSALHTVTLFKSFESHRFKRFSTWKSLVRAITCLAHIARSFQRTNSNDAKKCKGWHHCQEVYTIAELQHSKNFIIRTVQQEIYTKEIACITNSKSIPKDSSLKKLDPFLDKYGLLRVGGRLKQASLEPDERNPLIIPGHHHVTRLIVQHYHIQVKHQGRLFTEGALHTAGLWIVGAKRCVSSIIFSCITCRKLRGMLQTQKMANLPADRLSMDPPFTNVGLDVFGPWSVTARQTRGGQANSKRWAVIFTCMTIRAVHIEVIESMDTSSFINALRRFIAIRGPVKHIRSDRGTNFIGAAKELQISSNIDAKAVERYLSDQDCTWTFNPPHSSHMGGAWERMIGIARRILDSIFLQAGTARLTHESLVTFMAEVTAIINARPLTPVLSDPEEPFLLTPATLLTQKTGKVSPPPGEFSTKDMYKRQWKQVQCLADTFWDRWKKQYISTLQPRNKWQTARPNLKPGDVVLLKDCQLQRNEWPLGLVTKTFPSEDGNVRKVEVKVCRQQETKLFLRPVCELILLLSPTE